MRKEQPDGKELATIHFPSARHLFILPERGWSPSLPAFFDWSVIGEEPWAMKALMGREAVSPFETGFANLARHGIKIAAACFHTL